MELASSPGSTTTVVSSGLDGTRTMRALQETYGVSVYSEVGNREPENAVPSGDKREEETSCSYCVPGSSCASWHF